MSGMPGTTSSAGILGRTAKSGRVLGNLRRRFDLSPRNLRPRLAFRGRNPVRRRLPGIWKSAPISGIPHSPTAIDIRSSPLRSVEALVSRSGRRVGRRVFCNALSFIHLPAEFEKQAAFDVTNWMDDIAKGRIGNSGTSKSSTGIQSAGSPN